MCFKPLTKEELKKQFKENQQTIQQLTEQNLMIKGYMEALEDLGDDYEEVIKEEIKEDNKEKDGE